MIQTLLVKMLTKEQYKNLSTIKKGVFKLPSDFLQFAVNLLPQSSRLTLKSATNVVEKMDYERYDIFLNIDSETEYQLRLHSCKKEPDTIHWIENFLREGDVLYDIGANIGSYSLVASKFFQGKVKVYAFEPAFMNFSQLCQNIYLNRCQDNIVPLQIALSDRTAVDSFNYSSLTIGGAQNSLGKPIDEKGKTFNPVFKQYILSYQIDDLIKNFELPVPNHLKIDVDGIEFLVLKGATETLANSSVRSIIVELAEGKRAKEVTEFMLNKGFELHSKHPRKAPGLFNYIFQRNAV